MVDRIPYQLPADSKPLSVAGGVPEPSLLETLAMLATIALTTGCLVMFISYILQHPRHILAVIAGLAAIALAVAALPMPYDYYLALRVAVFASGVFFGFTMLRNETDRALAISLLITAGVFNPFVPVHLTKAIWLGLNTIGAALFAWTAWRLRDR